MIQDSDAKVPLYGGGLTPEKVAAMQNTPRARIARFLYYAEKTGNVWKFKNCTPVSTPNGGALIGLALNPAQFQTLLQHPDVKGVALASAFFKQFSRDTDSIEVGRYIMNGADLDMFLDLLAGVATTFQRPSGLIVK